MNEKRGEELRLKPPDEDGDKDAIRNLLNGRTGLPALLFGCRA